MKRFFTTYGNISIYKVNLENVGTKFGEAPCRSYRLKRHNLNIFI